MSMRGWQRRVGLVAASGTVAALVAGGWGVPAFSQTPPNQSDITGTNVFNSVAPDFFDEYGDRLDPETLAEAQRLSDRLDEAYSACLESVDRAESQPRRFALGSGSSGTCTSAECEQFNSLLRETQQFLAQIQGTSFDVEQFLRDRPW